MPRIGFAFLLAGFAGCHAFGARTSDEDRALNNFAEARQRAATYYDGRDYTRAALQYQRALEYRPDHVPSRLGYAYSLTYANKVSTCVEAVKQFERIGKRPDQALEVKRIYGNALALRNLAAHYQRRARIYESKGRVDLAGKDDAQANDYARRSLALFQQVLRIDDELAAQKVVGPMRVSASLKPDAHIAMAHCEIILADAQHLGHLDRARDHILAFANIAEKARKFWKSRRERLLHVDPGREEQAAPGARTMGAAQRERYEMRIVGTIKQEVVARAALLETYLYLNRFRDAINEATLIINLDPTRDEVYLLRGNAYAFLDPPNYALAIKDLKEYRSRLDRERLTDEWVEINRRILVYEKRMRAQQGETG